MEYKRDGFSEFSGALGRTRETPWFRCFTHALCIPIVKNTTIYGPSFGNEVYRREWRNFRYRLVLIWRIVRVISKSKYKIIASGTVANLVMLHAKRRNFILWQGPTGDRSRVKQNFYERWWPVMATLVRLSLSLSHTTWQYQPLTYYISLNCDYEMKIKVSTELTATAKFCDFESRLIVNSYCCDTWSGSGGT